jgi:hypothetical protein
LLVYRVDARRNLADVHLYTVTWCGPTVPDDLFSVSPFVI